MEKTKVWVVSRSTTGYFGFSHPEAVFLSKIEAEFFVWSKNKDTEYGFEYAHYTTKEAHLHKEELRGGGFEKFRKQRISEIEGCIAAKRQCAESDEAAIQALEQEKSELI